MSDPVIAIMASGSGTTAEAFIRAGAEGKIKTQVGLVIVSREDAGIFERIINLNKEFNLSIPTELINHKTHPLEPGEVIGRGEQTKAEQQAIAQKLKESNIDAVALLGYMKHVGDLLINLYGWLPTYTSMYQAAMLNTHPGLLPDTKAKFGKQIQDYVLEHQLPYGGQTLHIVSSEYDAGPIVAEHRVLVEDNDTPDSLFERVQAVEKQNVPIDIDAFVIARQAFLNN